MGSEDKQEKGILLASISREMLRCLIEVLKMNGKKVIASRICTSLYDTLKTDAFRAENPMVLVRKKAYHALMYTVNTTISTHINRVDTVHAQLTLSDSAFP